MTRIKRIPRERLATAEVSGAIHTGSTPRSPYWSQEAGRVFYVSVRDAGRNGILLGPYETHPEALDNVRRGRRLAQEVDVRGDAAFYYYGTCSMPRDQHCRPIFGS